MSRPTGVYPSRREELAARRAEQRMRAQRRRRRLAAAGVAVLLLLAGVVGGAYLLYDELYGGPEYADYEGTGGADVVVKVDEGATGAQIGTELRRLDVVQSVQAFTVAAAEEPRIRSVQPGYYRMRQQMSGESAVALLLDPASRVGQLEIRGGVQLDDTSNPDGSVVPGVLSLVAQATCAELNGQQRCVTADELRETMSTADLAELGVPDWARDDVAQAEPRRRLEGLFVPGRYDVPPGVPALDVLRGLLATSVTRLESEGLVGKATATGYSAYDVLIISSLVEKEAITPDMPKVSRVLYNRLESGQRLQLDSMVNYPLDLQALRTTPEDRARPGPYNSYAVAGLPPTPIAAPGSAAIAAALQPAAGPWQYFVRCQTDGTSCFAETLDEHNANVAQAVANGAF